MKKLYTLALLTIFCTASCVPIGKPADAITSYTLEYTPPKFEGLVKLPVVIKINRFAVAPDYNTMQMIYRDQDFTRQEYPYHRWRANPGDLLSYLLERDLRNTDLFSAVLGQTDLQGATHTLQGNVDTFYEHDGSIWQAKLALDITLIDNRQVDLAKSYLLQKKFSTQEKIDDHGPQGLAQAMSRAMARLSAQMVKNIYQTLGK